MRNTRKKGTEVDQGIWEMSGIKDFFFVNLVWPKHIRSRLHLVRKKEWIKWNEIWVKNNQTKNERKKERRFQWEARQALDWEWLLEEEIRANWNKWLLDLEWNWRKFDNGVKLCFNISRFPENLVRGWQISVTKLK